jgi:hypothetical protein
MRCCGLCYCYDYACLIVKLGSLLAFGAIVYIAAGSVGLVVSEFSAVQWQMNQTQAIERGVSILTTWYETGSLPSVFKTWAITATVLWTIGCIVYIVVRCQCIAQNCIRHGRYRRIGGHDEEEDDDNRDGRRRPSDRAIELRSIQPSKIQPQREGSREGDDSAEEADTPRDEEEGNGDVSSEESRRRQYRRGSSMLA